MKQHDQIRAFADELEKLCDRFANEFDLSSAAAIGVLSMKIHLIERDLLERLDLE